MSTISQLGYYKSRLYLFLNLKIRFLFLFIFKINFIKNKINFILNKLKFSLLYNKFTYLKICKDVTVNQNLTHSNLPYFLIKPNVLNYRQKQSKIYSNKNFNKFKFYSTSNIEKINNNLKKDAFLLYLDGKEMFMDFSYNGRLVLKNKFKGIPGIYLWVNKNNNRSYIGKSVNLYIRISKYFSTNYIRTKKKINWQSVEQ